MAAAEAVLVAAAEAVFVDLSVGVPSVFWLCGLAAGELLVDIGKFVPHLQIIVLPEDAHPPPFGLSAFAQNLPSLSCLLFHTFVQPVPRTSLQNLAQSLLAPYSLLMLAKMSTSFAPATPQNRLVSVSFFFSLLRPTSTTFLRCAVSTGAGIVVASVADVVATTD